MKQFYDGFNFRLFQISTKWRGKTFVKLILCCKKKEKRQRLRK